MYYDNMVSVYIFGAECKNVADCCKRLSHLIYTQIAKRSQNRAFAGPELMPLLCFLNNSLSAYYIF